MGFSNFFPKNRFLAIFGPFCLLGPAKRPKIAIFRKIASFALKVTPGSKSTQKDDFRGQTGARSEFRGPLGGFLILVIFTGPSPQKPKIGFLGSRELGLVARLGAENLPGCSSVRLDLAGNFPAPTDSLAPRTSAAKNPILGFSRVFGLFKAFQRTRPKSAKNAFLGQF